MYLISSSEGREKQTRPKFVLEFFPHFLSKVIKDNPYFAHLLTFDL